MTPPCTNVTDAACVVSAWRTAATAHCIRLARSRQNLPMQVVRVVSGELHAATGSTDVAIEV